MSQRRSTVEEVEDWLVNFERRTGLNQWDDAAELRVYFYLEDGTHTWFQNCEEQLMS